MMRILSVCLVLISAVLFCAEARGFEMEFTLLTHPDNVGRLPQPRGIEGVSGDHLIRTEDDIFYPTYNPYGSFSYLFMNPHGIIYPDYPPLWAQGIHCLRGSYKIEIDTEVFITDIDFDGYVTPGYRGKESYQYLVNPGDPVTCGEYGYIDGTPNQIFCIDCYGYDNPIFAFQMWFDTYLDVPFADHPSIDMTFNDYIWNGYCIPAEALTYERIYEMCWYDRFGYFAWEGGAEWFTTWVMEEVAPRLPPEADYLCFAAGSENPTWKHPLMGMTYNGVIDQMIVAYASDAEPQGEVFCSNGLGQQVPEPFTAALVVTGLIATLFRLRLNARTHRTLPCSQEKTATKGG